MGNPLKNFRGNLGKSSCLKSFQNVGRLPWVLIPQKMPPTPNPLVAIPQATTKTRNVFPGAFGDSSITSRSGTGPFFNRDPPKKMVRGFGESVQQKKGGDSVMSSRIFLCVFFLDSESGF